MSKMSYVVTETKKIEQLGAFLVILGQVCLPEIRYAVCLCN
jgi:hypothetical protein